MCFVGEDVGDIIHTTYRYGILCWDGNSCLLLLGKPSAVSLTDMQGMASSMECIAYFWNFFR
jgi:hypothetical protein